MMSRCTQISGLILIVFLVGCRRGVEPDEVTSAPVVVASSANVEGEKGDSRTSSEGGARRDSRTSGSGGHVARVLSENEKIEAMIASLGGLEGAVFIRNGTEHDVAEAIEHMRRKWNWKSKEIRTAEDFIRIAASQSSISGERYMIRFADQREVPSNDWFRARLRDIAASE